MSIEEHEILNFLTELYNMTDGDISQQVSMYDIGAALGLEKSNAGTIAEELIVDGYAELVSLSGGISITSEGLKELNITPVGSSEINVWSMGDDRILSDKGREAVEDMLVKIKECVTAKGNTYVNIEEIVIDIKTAEIQLLSQKSKTGIIREVLISLKESMSITGNTDVSGQIGTMIGN